jgi:hypothetical protein
LAGLAVVGCTGRDRRPPVERFPSIEPFERGMLDVGDDQRIY